VRRGSRHQFWGNIGGTDEVYLLGAIADSHVHVDISLTEAVAAVNTFHALSGAQIALTANSTLWCGGIDWEYKDVKETFWNRWLPHPPQNGRTGVNATPFDSLEHYIDTVCSFKPVFVSRNGESVGIYEYDTFKDYFYASPALGKTANGKIRRLKPSLVDIDLHDTFYWWNARISRFFTLENRCNSQQPPQEIVTIPALTLGIVENLTEMGSVLQQCGYTWNELTDSRESAIRLGLEASVGNDPVTVLCGKMIAVAESGLRKRGLGEEVFLSPLWQRLQEGRCPADKVREDFLEGGIERVGERYSFA
jgi:gamma-glutamylcysteine synthetase